MFTRFQWSTYKQIVKLVPDGSWGVVARVYRQLVSKGMDGILWDELTYPSSRNLLPIHKSSFIVEQGSQWGTPIHLTSSSQYQLLNDFWQYPKLPSECEPNCHFVIDFQYTGNSISEDFKPSLPQGDAFSSFSHSITWTKSIHHWQEVTFIYRSYWWHWRDLVTNNGK